MTGNSLGATGPNGGAVYEAVSAIWTSILLMNVTGITTPIGSAIAGEDDEL